MFCNVFLHCEKNLSGIKDCLPTFLENRLFTNYALFLVEILWVLEIVQQLLDPLLLEGQSRFVVCPGI